MSNREEPLLSTLHLYNQIGRTMSSFKVYNTILIIFIVLTLIFGSLSAYEFFQIEQLKSSSITTSTTAVILIPSTTFTTTTTLTTQALSDRGLIRVYDGVTVKVFEYMKWNSSTPNTLTFNNVTFTLWTNTTVTNTAGS
jgi:hypothetical protein